MRLTSRSFITPIADFCFPERKYAASVWTVMRNFGYKDLPAKLNGTGIHSLDNVMTLDYTVHTLFDNLQLWFEGIVRDLDIFSPCTLNVRS